MLAFFGSQKQERKRQRASFNFNPNNKGWKIAKELLNMYEGMGKWLEFQWN
jgi:hypothetical protein